MTDLERAQDAIRQWASDEHRELRLIGKSQAYLPALTQIVADAIAAARREGAAEMREAAIEAIQGAIHDAYLPTEDHALNLAYRTILAGAAVRAVRAPASAESA